VPPGAGPAAAAGRPDAGPSAPAAAGEAGQRTEAAATQAQSGVRSNDKAPGTPGGPGPDPTAWTAQQIKEYVAELRRKRAAEQQRE
jgi:hypothetical protein